MGSQNLQDADIAQALSNLYGYAVHVEPVHNEDFKEQVKDATLKFLAPMPDGGAGFLLVSGAGNPQLVRRAVDNIRQAREAVSVLTGAPVLQPAITGEAAGRSFAVWPYKPPFAASNRLLLRLRKYLYAGRIASWAEAFCQETLTVAAPHTVRKDLCRISEDSELSDAIRASANEAMTRLENGQWRPMHCLQHGDFWTENLLLASRGEAASFYVIDWAGMQREGYPFLDLMRILSSLRRGRGFNSRCVERMRQSIGCDRQDITAYMLCAYGRIGRTLEHFPLDRYRAGATAMYHFARMFD